MRVPTEFETNNGMRHFIVAVQQCRRAIRKSLNFLSQQSIDG